MANSQVNIPPPPKGFQLDSIPPPPKGFVLDGIPEEPEGKGFFDIIGEQIKPSPVSFGKGAGGEALLNILDLIGQKIPTAAIPVGEGTFLEKLEREKRPGEFIPDLPAMKVPSLIRGAEPIELTSEQTTDLARGVTNIFGDLFLIPAARLPKIMGRAIKALSGSKKAVTPKNLALVLRKDSEVVELIKKAKTTMTPEESQALAVAIEQKQPIRFAPGRTPETVKKLKLGERVFKQEAPGILEGQQKLKELKPKIKEKPSAKEIREVRPKGEVTKPPIKKEGKPARRVPSKPKAEEITLPKFTKESRTEDALEFGKKVKDNKVVIKQLADKEAELKKVFDAEKDVNKKLIIAHERQLYREAREVAMGKGGAAEFVAKTGETKPPEVIPKTAPEDAKKVEQLYVDTGKALKEKKKIRPSNIIANLRRTVVDVSGNVKSKMLKLGGKEGKEAVMHKDLIAGAHSKAVNDYEKVANKLYKGLTKNEEDVLNNIIQSRRVIAIEQYKKIKHPGGLGELEHGQYLDSLPQKLKDKLISKADDYFAEMKNQLTQLKDESVISEKLYKDLVSKGDYAPRQFIQHIDPDMSFAGRKITTGESGIKSLDEGSMEFLETNSRLLLSEVINRTQTRIFRNRANKALYRIGENIPDNGIVQIAKPNQKVPAGFEKIGVRINGEEKAMFMPNELAKEWVKNDPMIDAKVANWASWILGGKILKPMATGLNPEFALTNMPRDIAHIMLTTQEYSKHLPIAPFQMGKDILKVSKDAITRKGRYLDYINEGGGMEFLTHQGRITSKTQGKLGQVQNVLGYMGETSEIFGRLALRERALRNLAKQGKVGIEAQREATWIARNYLDFSQGGSFAKVVDIGVPYLNAAIQGTRGIFRAAVQKPGVFAYKVGQVATFSSAIYLANKNQNPEAWAEISDREKTNNFIITTPFQYTDKNGDKRYIYFKIAKDQGQRIISTIAENLMAKWLGEEVDTDQITQAVGEFIPLSPTNILPPTVDAMLGYAANKDFWRNEDIWKGINLAQAKEEYTRFTHPAFVEFGKYTGLSPERSKTALQQFFTYGNIYTSLVGHGWNVLFEDMPEKEKEKITEEFILKQPFVRRVVNVTNPFTKHEKKIKEAKLKADTEKFVRTREFDTLVQSFFNDDATNQDIKDFYKKTKEPREKIRLIKRFTRSKRIKDIPERRFWLNLGDLDPETRATVFWNRWRTESEEKQKELTKTMFKIPGFTTKRFLTRFGILKSKLKKELNKE